MRTWTHTELVTKAAVFLRRKYPIVITEISGGCEEPDAIGFDSGGRTTLIECKASKEDFKRDAEKFCRRNPDNGIGDCRYFMAPKGMLSISEIQGGWGLLSVTDKGLIVMELEPCVQFTKNHNAETRILISLLRRIGILAPDGISIKCYTYETKNRATIGIQKPKKEAGNGRSEIREDDGRRSNGDGTKR